MISTARPRYTIVRRLYLPALAAAVALLTACPPPDDDGDTGVDLVDADAGDGGDIGGDGGGDAGPEKTCAHQNDGVCDEPADCPLGTDDADCEEACNNKPDRQPFIGAACEHRDLVDLPRQPDSHYEDPSPTEGSSHLTGWRDGTLQVPSGQNLNREIPRHFRVYVPPTYDPDRAHPVMITMAGHRVSHWVLGGYTMLHRTATANDFIVIYAGQEFRGRWAWWTEWYGSGMNNPPSFCQQQSGGNNPDYEFIRKLIDWASEEYNVDQRRIYLSGHSRGASMALIAALEMPDRIAGAAVESGFTECGFPDEVLGDSWDNRHVPISFVHGVEDDDVCINCGPGESTCAANPDRSCSRGFHASDALVEKLKSLGWEEGKNLEYHRLERVAHRWQSHLNQQIWDFLSTKPLP